MPQRQLNKTERFVENTGVVLFVWAVFSLFTWVSRGASILTGNLLGNDDNMRMAEIRDWLGGQNWTDLHQYRLNPSDPLLSHWSRINDVIFGLPIKALTPFIGQTNAEMIAVTVIPTLMFLAYFFLLVAITRYLFSSRGTALTVALLAGLSFFATVQFTFGRIDHHGLQILLALLCLFLILRSEAHPSNAALAGLVAGVGLSVGIESALYVGAACIAITLAWVFNEDTSRRRMRGFGIALATSTAVLLLVSAPRNLWGQPFCDANSIVFVFLTLSIALAMALLSAVGTKVNGVFGRLFMAALFGGAALLGTIILFPQCLNGPYAQVDPRLVDLWLTNVSETENIFESLKGDVYAGVTALTFLVMALVGWLVYHKYEGSGFSPAPRTLLVFVMLCALGGAMQIRLQSFAMAAIVPFFAFLILYGFRATEAMGKLKKWGLRLGLVALICPLTVPSLVSAAMPNSKNENADQATRTAEKKACVGASTLKSLNQLGAGFAITQIDLGAPILNHTALSVSSAPYHRNTSGNLLGFDVFLSDPKDAKSIVDNAHAKYVILCSHFPETRLLIDNAPDGLAAHLISGDIPHWLSPVTQPKESHLLVYKVAAPTHP